MRNQPTEHKMTDTHDILRDQKPLWSPMPEVIENTNLARLLRTTGLTTFTELHHWSVEQREAFWTESVNALGVTFDTPYEKVLDVSSGTTNAKWFQGGRLNIANSCFNRAPDKPAIITRRWTGEHETISLGELASLSRRAAAGFVEAGVQPGQGIAIVSMMSVEAIAAYLGALLAGAYVVSIPESLPADEISLRIRIGKAVLIVCHDALPRAGKVHPL
jgi:acetyl-CoA synthetase